MSWIILALLTAFFYSLSDLFSKISLKKVDEYVTSWAIRMFSLPFILCVLFFIPVPVIKPGFWLGLVVSGTLNILVTILYLKAIKDSDLSLTIPMISFTPLFLLITSPIILGEFPNWEGLSGIIFIVAGAYMLNISGHEKSFLDPVKAIFTAKGPRLMLLVSFIWSITANFDKIAIRNSSSLFYSLAVTIYMAIGLTPLMLWMMQRKIHKQKQEGSGLALALRQIRSSYKSLILVGLCISLVLIFQMLAVNMTLVAYVIAIKRLSILGGVVWGYFFFREKNIRHRLAGAFMMLAGVVLITLFS